jgi:hypothetical protein
MSAEPVSDRKAILAAVASLKADVKALSALPLNQLTHPELLALLDELETLARQQPAIAHQIINRLAAEADPNVLGARSLADVLAMRLRISKKDVRRRVKHAELLRRRTALTGEVLPPQSPNTAAQQRGQIGCAIPRTSRRVWMASPPSK